MTLSSMILPLSHIHSPHSLPSRRRPSLSADPLSKQDAVRTLAWTIDHLYKRGDVVHLLHVLPVSARVSHPSGSLSPIFLPPNPDDAAAALEAAASAFVRDRLYPEAAARGLDPEAVLRPTIVREPATETVAATIVRTAAELGAAQLVMISHAKPRLQEAIWGSVSKAVVAAARMPVTLVH